MKLHSFFRKKSIDQIVRESQSEHAESSLRRVLGVKDLTALGIAAIIGAGIFSSVGRACFDGGPAVSLLFVFTAITCMFSALCYAEFASRIPISGSAYTYAYISFGELIAWIIGWDLIMEYSIGNITVAAAWSGNFKSFLEGLGIHLPGFLSTSYMEVYKAHIKYMELAAQHVFISDNINALEQIWIKAPRLATYPIILNLPAFLSVLGVTMLVYVGIKESKRYTNIMVIFKVLVILTVIVVGLFYVQPVHWSPFAPNGFGGVMKGVSAVFFAYVGFDAISTTAEECRNPQRDLPRAMIYSLIICTVLYVAIALVLTGMVSYKQLDQSDFLAHSFSQIGLNWFSGILALSAVVATTGVMLVFQLGQPRIWLSMSRDGLLPKRFSTIHPRFKTPSFATWIAFLLVGLPSLVIDAELATDMSSIGTLFAFFLVCAGVLIVQNKNQTIVGQGKFRVPYINGRYALPLILVAGGLIIFLYDSQFYQLVFSLETYSKIYSESIWQVIPYIVFVFASLCIIYFTVRKRLSLIPVLGVWSCFYLITEMGFYNWVRFLVWLVIGLIIYFIYSFRKSKLNNTDNYK